MAIAQDTDGSWNDGAGENIGWRGILHEEIDPEMANWKRGLFVLTLGPPNLLQI